MELSRTHSLTEKRNMEQLTHAALKEGLLIQVRDEVKEDKHEYIGEPGTKHRVILRDGTYCVMGLHGHYWWLVSSYVKDFDLVYIPPALLLT